MERIILYLRTPAKSGEIKVRLRLTEGREVALFHKTGIKATAADLAKFDIDGRLKQRVSVYNYELARSLEEEIRYMHEAYASMKEKGLDMTSDIFEKEIADLKNPKQAERKAAGMTLLQRFERFIDDSFRDGIICELRYKHYRAVLTKLHRYLTINGMSQMAPAEFTEENILNFRLFIFDEYKYVDKYPKLYKECNERNKPKQRLNLNTVTTHLKKLQTFFNELESRDEIIKSPFRKIGTERKKAVMRTMFDEPYFLYSAELQKVLNTKVSEDLQEVKDAFLLQCALGCRIGDFQSLSMENVAVSPEGIAYIHYLPDKTRDGQETNIEVQTPLVRFALEIVKRTKFNFPITKYPCGQSGYNAKIKTLLRVCKIDRKVPIYDDTIKDNTYKAIHDIASSKLCRKTHVDIMNKVQVNMYAAGLHKEGSGAVTRYTKLELKDRFALMCTAFGQPSYKADKNLKIRKA